MEREQAFQLARTLDQRGFEQHLTSRDGQWQISVRIEGLDRHQLADLMGLLAEAEAPGRADDRGYVDVR